MFKRTLILALVVALPLFFFGGSDESAVASPNVPVGWDLGNPNVFQGLPDNDVAMDQMGVLRSLSARFLVFDGPGNFGLGQNTEGRETNILLTYETPNPSDNVRIALYDPDSTGLWDQRVDGNLVSFAPEVLYKLYAVPEDGTSGRIDQVELDALLALLNDNDPSNDPPAEESRSALTDYATGADDQWCAYYDKMQMDVPEAAKHGTRVRLLLHIHMFPNPASGTPPVFSGQERVGHKVAFNGTYLFPKGAVVGFAGGAIDERAVPVNATLVHSSMDPATVMDRTQATLVGDAQNPNGVRWYDGRFNFHFHSTHACDGNIVFDDADADWNQPGQGFDPNPTGIPPDNTALYLNPRDPVFPGVLQDISAFIINPIIDWAGFPIPGYAGHDGTTVPANPPFDAANTAPGGTPSITVAQQLLVPPLLQAFQRQTLDKPTIDMSPGLWCLRWEGVDKANFIWMRFDPATGTTPKDPTLTGRVFCDAPPRNGTFDAGEEPPFGAVELAIQRIDCTTGNAIGAPFNIMTNADGTWPTPADAPLSVPFGCYEVDIVTPIPATKIGTWPIRVDVQDVDPTGKPIWACTGDAQMPLDCTCEASGRVWCDAIGPLGDGSCDNEFVQGVDAPLENVVVDLFKDAGVIPFASALTAADGTYMFDDLTAGAYRIVVRPGQAIVADKIGPNPLERTFACPGANNETSYTNQDFSYCTRLCGNVYCEDTGDCTFGAGDMALPAGYSATVKVTPLDAAGAPVTAMALTRTVTPPMTQWCVEPIAGGMYLVEVTLNTPPGGRVLKLRPGCLATKTADVPCDNRPAVLNCDTGYDCTSCRAGGRVWCDGGGNCDNQFQMGTDLPVEGLQIDLIKAGDPMNPFRTTNTAPDGTYTFADIPAGDYTVVIPAGQGQVTNLVGPTPMQHTFTCPGPNNQFLFDNRDFSFCTKICGDVYCETGTDCSYDPVNDRPLPAGYRAFVTLKSLDPNGPADAMQEATPANPMYCFDPVGFGRYEVSVVLVPPPGGNLLPLANGCTSPKPVTLDKEVKLELGCDFGFKCVCETSGRVWCDGGGRGCDQVWTPGVDSPVAGLTMELVQNNVVGATTMTAADGTYTFGDLVPGAYTVRVQAGQAQVAQKIGPMPANYSFTCTGSENFRNRDFVYCTKLCGNVYCEDGPDCTWDPAGDRPLPPGYSARVTLKSLDPGGAPDLMRTVTSPNTEYCFDPIAFGNYEVSVVLIPPAGKPQLPLGQACPGTTKMTTLDTQKPRELNCDFGFKCLCETSGRIWCDGGGRGCDGIWAPGADIPLGGITVELLMAGAAVNPIATTMTFADGTYGFPDLAPGDYTVRVLAGQAALAEKIGPMPVDRTFTCTGTEGFPNQDFWFCTKICGDVYCEDTGDCDYDVPGDRPLPPGYSARVTLTSLDAGGAPPSNITVTAPNTRYCFEPIAAGNYQVSVTLIPPAGGVLLPSAANCPNPKPVTLDLQKIRELDCDFGFDCDCATSGRVWCDGGGRGCDGIWTPNADIPLQGVTMELLLGPNVVATTMTAADGTYTFGDLNQPGIYTVRVQAGQAALAEKIGPMPPDRSFECKAGERFPDQDFWFCTKICGDVYCEDTSDCDYDVPGDRPLPAGYSARVTLTSLDAGGAPPSNITVTAPNTRYCFEPIAAGNYEVSVTLIPPAGSPMLPTAANCPSMKTVTLDLQKIRELDCDFGFDCTCTTSGRVWCDGGGRGCDGIWMPTADIPLQGVIVELLNPPAVPRTTMTAADGTYTFGSILPGNYTVRIQPGQAALMDKIGPMPATRDFVCSGRENFPDRNFWFCTKLCGNVYCEDGPDCQFDAMTDRPLPPGYTATVTLTSLDPGGAPPITRTVPTPGAGPTFYCFEPIAFGNYEVSVVLTGPPGAPVILPANGCPTTKTTTLDTNNPRIVDCDFGFDCVCQTSGRIWCEPFGGCNGIFEPGPDQAIGGLEVHLFLVGNPANPFATTMTAADGTYSFGDLKPGSYRIEIPVTPANQLLVGKKTGPMPPNRMFRCEGIEPHPNQDFWYCQKPAMVVGSVFCDVNGNGMPDLPAPDFPVDGIQVELRTAGQPTRTAFTDAMGNYSFDNVAAGTYVVAVDNPAGQFENHVPRFGAPDMLTQVVMVGPGDVADNVFFIAKCLGRIVGTVWKDPLGDCNGVLDTPGDTRLQGITVQLTGPTAADVTTTMTGPLGNYEFVDLPLGDYSVTVLDPNPNPDNCTFHVSVAPPAPSTGMREVDVVLDDPSEEERVDYGFCIQAISGKVYKQPFGDWDQDFDPGVDTPLAGITVEILGVAGDAFGFNDTTQTGPNGNYRFDDVPTGSFEIRVGANQPQLVDLLTDGAAVLTPTLVVGDVAPDQDFPYCEQDCPQSLCVFVFKEKCETSEECGKCDGKVTELTLRHDGNRTVAVKVIQKKDDDVIFEDDVAPGEEFTFAGTDKKGTMGTEIRVWSPHGDVNIHTSCSQSIGPGLVFGKFTVVSGRSRNGGELCPGGDGGKSGKSGKSGHSGKWGKSRGSHKSGKSGKSGKPHIEIKCNCDGEFVEGEDEPVPGVRVRVEQLTGPDAGRVFELVTDGNGRACSEELRPTGNSYQVTVIDGQPVLANTEPSPGLPITRRVDFSQDECFEKITVPFGFCPTCPEVPCCVGDLHEVVTETRFRLETPGAPIDLKVGFYADCDGAELIDHVGLKFDGPFPGPITGMDDVLTLEDVKVHGDIATVRVRINANGTYFPTGVFGTREYRLAASLNCRTNPGCSVFRCEYIRPGAWFTWDESDDSERSGKKDWLGGWRSCHWGKGCPPRPPCDIEWYGTERDADRWLALIGDGPGRILQAYKKIGTPDKGKIGKTPDDQKRNNDGSKMTGAIQTTVCDGSRVNGNIYWAREDVYLNGGPQIQAPAFAGALPEGDYYFQVTDPSGKTLLSLDPIDCREFHVSAQGVITSVGGPCAHATGVDRDHAQIGSITVQLFPYARTPNNGGEYKVWVTPVDKYDPTAGKHGFIHHWSKTDNWKVKVPGCAPMWVVRDVMSNETFRKCICTDCEECKPCKGGVVALTLRYDGNRAARITVGKPGKVVFDGNVEPGGTFSYTGEKPGGKVPEEVYINGVLDVKIHTSCSQDVSVGTRWGSFTVAGGASKDGGPFCGDIPPPECECKGPLTKIKLRHDGDKTVSVRIKDQDNRVLFEDTTTEPGQIIELNGSYPGGVFGEKIKIWSTWSDIWVWTNCDEIEVGAEFSKFTVIGGASRDGGKLCGDIPPPEPCIDNELFILRDHPDGAKRPPTYGLRLDELIDVTDGHDVFTFSFDPKWSRQVDMKLTVDRDNNVVKIFGTAYGGLDVGTTWSMNSRYVGLWDIEMVYDSSNTSVDADGHVLVAGGASANGRNTGTISKRGGGPVIPLIDWSNGRTLFHFNESGHRGGGPWVGWGWLTHGGWDHVSASDWLFTAYSDCEPPPPCDDCEPDDCGKCDGKVTELTLRYDGPGTTRVTVTQKKDGDRIFDGMVSNGQPFTFVGTDDKGTMGTEITVRANGLSTAIHTSCSKPIGPGLVFGQFTVISGKSRNGGVLCKPGEGCKSCKSGKSGKSGGSHKSGKSGKSGGSHKSGKSGKSGGSHKSGKSGKSGGSHKSGKSGKSGGSHKSGKSGKSGGSHKSGKSGKSGGSHKSGKSGKSGGSHKSGKSGKSGGSHKSGKSGKSGGSHKSGKSGKSGGSHKSGKSGKSGGSHKSGKSGKSGGSHKSGKSGKSGGSHKSGKSGKSGGSHKSGKSGKSGGSHKSGKSGKSGGSDKSGKSGKS